MGLRKRKGSPNWQIEFTLRGRAVRESSHTTDRKAAEAKEHELRAQIWAEMSGTKPTILWEDAVAEWCSPLRKGGKKSLWKDEQIFTRAGIMWNGKPLSEITEEMIQKYANEIATATSIANCRRHMSQIKALFKAVYKWKKLGPPPAIEVPAIPADQRFVPVTLSKDECEQLIRLLPGHLVSLVTFSLETGLRFGNVARLRWKGPGPHVNLDDGTIFIPGTHFKNGKDHMAPLSTRALDVIRDMERSSTGYVFTDHRGRGPIKSVKTAWGRATTKAGCSGYRVHDLRHTWATAHIRAGTPSRALQELSGWSDSTMVKLYTHLNVADLRQYVK